MMLKQAARNCAVILCFAVWCSGQSHADSIDLYDGAEITGAITSFADGAFQLTTADGGARVVPVEDATAVSFDPRTVSDNENRRLVFAGHPGDDSPVMLRAGYHKLVFVYSGKAPKLQYSLDGEIPTLVPPSMFYAPEKARNFKPSPGLDSAGYRLPESPGNVRQGVTFRQYSSRSPVNVQSLNDTPLKLVKSGWNDDVQSQWSASSRMVGIFTGMVRVESDGEYRFLLAGNKSASLYLGTIPPEIMAMMKRKQMRDAAWAIELAAGGLIAGSIERWGEGVVQVKTLYSQLPVLELPVGHVRRIYRAGEEVGRANSIESEDDVILAKVNDDRTTRIVGRVNGLENNKLSIRYKNQDRLIALDKVVELQLGGQKYSVPRICYQQLEMSAVCNFPTTLKSVTDTSVVVKTAWGQEFAVTHDGAALLRMVIRNGRVQYLSEVVPAKVEETPFFDRMMHWKADRSLIGSALTVGKKEFRRGLAMHSRTKLSYDLAGAYDQFISTVGISPEVSHLGDVMVRVIGDEQIVFEQRISGTQEINIDVDVSDVQLLTLVTDFGEGQDVGDRVHWGDARIVRQSQ